MVDGPTPILVADQVTTTYGGTTALDSVDLELYPDKVLVLWGGNPGAQSLARQQAMG